MRKKCKEPKIKSMLALDRVAGNTCSGCGFFDPQAIEDDPDLVDKIFDSLNGDQKFACHAGFPTNAFGQYIPTIQQQESAPLCAGFAALKSELAKQGEKISTPKHKIQLCLEIIRRGRLSLAMLPGVRLE